MEGREAVASLCGLILRRLQDSTGVPGALASLDETSVTVRDLERIFGEALQQFSSSETVTIHRNDALRGEEKTE